MHPQLAASPASTTAVHVSQVQNELDTADKGLNHLHENILRLRERLTPVLRQQPVSAQKDACPQPTLVPLAEAIASRNAALIQTNQILDGILEALDL